MKIKSNIYKLGLGIVHQIPNEEDLPGGGGEEGGALKGGGGGGGGGAQPNEDVI